MRTFLNMEIFNIREILLFLIIYSPVFCREELKCYQCSGIEDCGTKPENKFLIKCKKQVDSQTCFEVVKDDSTMVRGCQTDPTYAECRSSAANCVECSVSGCNNLLTTVKKAELACHKCDSRNDSSCVWTLYDQNVQRCTNVIPKYVKEKCYTKKIEDGSFRRGCIFDDALCTKENEQNCLTCELNGCNRDFVRAQECIQITEDKDRKNRTNFYKDLVENDVWENDEYPENFEELYFYSNKNSKSIIYSKGNGRQSQQYKALCTATEQYYNTRGCYVMTKDSATVWGCAVDLQPEILNMCKQNEMTCKYCADDDCDHMKAPNPSGSPNTIALTSAVAVITLLLYVYL